MNPQERVCAIGALAMVLAAMTSGCSPEVAVPSVSVTGTQTLARVSPSPSPEASSTERLTQAPSPSLSTSPTPTPTPTPEIPPALEIAKHLQERVKSAFKVQKVTVKNDPNDLLGRPDGYISAAYILDENAGSVSELSVDNGVKIEVFKSDGDAQRRYDYVRDLLRENPIFGAEYTHVEGPVILRVAGEVPPKVARRYLAVFRDFMESYL